MTKIYQYVPMVGYHCPVCDLFTGIDGRCGCYGVVSQTIRIAEVSGTAIESDAYARKMSPDYNGA